MKLFTFVTSPYARKVRIAMDYKGIAYEPAERCYSLDRKPDLRETSIRAEVPVLVLDDGRRIADSTIICEYLEQTHPNPPLYPRDAFERARMRSLEDLCDRAFDAVSYGYFIAMLRADAPEAPAMKAAAKAEYEALFGVLERELGDRDYFCGELSLADIAAVCHVPTARAMNIDPNQFKKLQAWTEQMRTIPAVAADLKRMRTAMAKMTDIASELVGPDGRIHWRDTRLEWPVRHGFIDFVAREFKGGKMMFPPDAA
jgi:glutathione S-transferase